MLSKIIHLYQYFAIITDINTNFKNQRIVEVLYSDYNSYTKVLSYFDIDCLNRCKEKNNDIGKVMST